MAAAFVLEIVEIMEMLYVVTMDEHTETQELLTCQEHLSSPPVYSGVRVV
jgi:hypothetical protein